MKKHDLIASLRENVLDISEVVEARFLPLTNQQLNSTVLPGWSIAQCIEHLNRYNNFYLPEIMSAVDSSQQYLADHEITSTWIGRKSIAMMNPSNTKKQSTFKRMNPESSVFDKSVLTEFLQHQRDIMTILNKAQGVNVNAKKVPVEFFKLLKMTIAEALQFVVVHEQRHIGQALRVLASIETNKAPVLAL